MLLHTPGTYQIVTTTWTLEDDAGDTMSACLANELTTSYCDARTCTRRKQDLVPTSHFTVERCQ